MDNQDKIFDKFKEAAHNAESKDFPGMEKVWSRVEEKLDKKEDKKAISLWKKIAVAASLLLLISLGAQFLKSDKISTTQTPKIVVKEKETIQNSVVEKNKAVVSSDSEIMPKAEAVKIIEQQIKEQPQVALQEVQITTSDAMAAEASPSPVAGQIAPAISMQSGFNNMEEETTTEKAKEVQNFGYGTTVQRESAKVAYADTQAPMSKKSAPLIVINGNPLSHSDDQKRDKMMQKEIPNLQPENVDSLVVLEQPLYIIDGIYYSEYDLFGPNPTSPYAPLNKQEIKTITVLQDLEATSKYGEKGKKGVVIITTKTGKPAAKN
ncbi:hypothetical protein [Flavobacterium pectinovorum]|uniref:TonB-dependent outer membrane receptor, SusC/RagA subfamily, signature region n=1 Tax=Flavobacterium pectinovorum TaxID=29533 RepID=A0A502EXI5_9FLAO|nr:hypothetical protein [Flavobacterium pectinovorum]TPG42257.1 hypothetical protein EAH81_08040 [Flavobacterium pectinovorum]